MTAKAKPAVTIDLDGQSYIWHYIGTPRTAYAHKESYIKRAYVDTDYKSRVALGLPKLIMPYYVYHKQVINRPLVPYIQGKAGDMIGYDVFFGTTSDNRTKMIAEAKAEAAMLWRKKLGKSSSINLGVALAEMKETVGLIASTALRLATAYRALKFLDVKGAFVALGIANNVRRPVSKYYRNAGMSARKHKYLLSKKAKIKGTDPVQFAAESWLELTYGWTPLLLDVYGGAEAVAKLQYETESDITVGVSTKRSLTVTPQSASNATMISSSGEVHVKYLYHLKIYAPLYRKLSALGLTNPMLIAWELVPFSFVVDWFLPVGNYLNSMSVTEGYKIVNGGYSEKLSMQAELVCKNASYVGAGLEVHEEQFTRSTVTTFPVNTFVVPDLSDMLNIRRFTSAVALLKVLT